MQQSATFAPDRVEGNIAVPGSSTVKLHGAFTIHGASHEITVYAATKVADDQMGVVITLLIPYVDWGMKDPSNFVLKVNKAVQVSNEASAPLKAK